MGKGSGRRPLLVDKATFEDNWDRIFSKKNKSDDSPLTTSKDTAMTDKKVTSNPNLEETFLAS